VTRQPLSDLAAQFRELRDELWPELEAVLASGRYVGGARVQQFESEFAAFCGQSHCVGVANGTDALRLALHAVGIGAGDEVITAANTFVATVEAILQAGARPVLVDVCPDTLLLDVRGLDAARTWRTRAVVPVHLYGRLCDMEAIGGWCRTAGVALVEDASQAHGARTAGGTAGSFGEAAAFSFYPSKNLGAAGDAGAIVTARAEVADCARRLRDHGQSARSVHESVGYNSRLDAIQAAVLSVKLRHLARWNERRRTLAGIYEERLEKLPGITLPAAAREREAHVYHLFVVQVDEREALSRALTADGIETGRHYPRPVHLQPAYRDLGGGDGTFPVAEASSQRILSLPLYPEMSEHAVHHVCDRIVACVER
jgi:dTDP-4-amino-4,6-dideoxygalactose transaminase